MQGDLFAGSLDDSCSHLLGKHQGLSKLQNIIVDLRIDADEYLRYYRGHARYVSCSARDGRSIQFPIPILNRFVTRDGINGSFNIQFDDNGKFVAITRL